MTTLQQTMAVGSYVEDPEIDFATSCPDCDCSHTTGESADRYEAAQITRAVARWAAVPYEAMEYIKAAKFGTPVSHRQPP